MRLHSYSFKIPSELHAYVDFAIYFEGGNIYYPDRLIPSPHSHFFINAGSPITLYPNCTKQNPVQINKGWIKCLHERPYCIKLGDYTKSVSIRFKPAAAYSLLAKPMHLYSNRILPAEKMDIPQFENLHEALLKTAYPAEVQSLVSNYLIQQLNPQSFELARVFKALELMSTFRSETSIQDIAYKIGVSTKYLITLFDKYIGLSPKKYRCILRFNALLPEIANWEYDDWMSLVVNYGYFDQSHFIRDFKRFTGLTPTEFINDYIFIDNNVFRKDANKQLLQPEMATN